MTCRILWSMDATGLRLAGRDRAFEFDTDQTEVRANSLIQRYLTLANQFSHLERDWGQPLELRIGDDIQPEF